MRILLLGGAGFIGRHLIDALYRAGLTAPHRNDPAGVAVFDNFEPVVHGAAVHADPPREITGQVEAVRVPVVAGDITDRSALLPLVVDADVIVHLAAGVSVSASHSDPARFIRTNVYGTAVLWNCIERRLRLGRPAPQVVNLSSMSLYGDTGASQPVTEDAKPDPLNVYALSKLQAEELCLLLGRVYDVPVTTLRLFNVYGPGQALHNAETGVVAIWLNQMLKRQPMTVFGDGTAVRDFIAVFDVARAIVHAIDHPLPQQVINIGTGRRTSILHVARVLADLNAAPEPSANGLTRPGDAQACFANISRATAWGFTAQIGLEDGLLTTLIWARQQHLIAV